METYLAKILNSTTHFNSAEIQAIESFLTKKTIPAKTQLVPYNKKTDELFILEKGCIRKYCIKDGQEITIFIVTEGQFAVEYVSFMAGTFSQNILETIEECDVMILKKKDLETLYVSIPKLNEAMRKILENVLLETQTMLNEFIMLSPEERYVNLIKKKPQLLNRIPQYVIASYLGISATSLSRIRKRITSK
ncbi:MAG: Crp/Fnr family transcriptional regulator [Saprospiraceae bacterium]|nr:Crp/Fnr family transcriptional regulator [Saprospiraceae bacterium]